MISLSKLPREIEKNVDAHHIFPAKQFPEEKINAQDRSNFFQHTHLLLVLVFQKMVLAINQIPITQQTSTTDFIGTSGDDRTYQAIRSSRHGRMLFCVPFSPLFRTVLYMLLTFSFWLLLFFIFDHILFCTRFPLSMLCFLSVFRP